MNVLSRTTRIIGLLLSMFLFGLNLFGQDIHYSQFYTSPVNLNPSLTGVFNGDTRLGMNYRNQWFKNNLANYLTATGYVDTKFYPKKSNKGFFGAGLLFNYDLAGDSKLSLAHLGLSGSYTRILNAKNLLSFGLMGGIAQRRFKTDDLVWDSQWNGDQVDQTIDPGEDFNRVSNGFLDLAAGINYLWQKSRRTSVNIGVGATHLNQPNQSFFEQTDEIKLPVRMAYSLLTSFQLTSAFDLLLHGLYQNQGPYKELLYGAYGKFHLNQKRGKELALLVGATLRQGDAFVPKVAIEMSNWYAGLSYDINFSDFQIATNRHGGPELSLIYRIVKVQPLNNFKTCPIY